MIRLVSAFLTLIIIFVYSNTFAQEHPENLSFVKQRLVQYHDSGQYYSDIAKVARHTLSYLRFRVNQNKQYAHHKKLAIVFDIDETALSNYQDMKAMDFGGTDQDYINAEQKAHDPAIPSVLTLYQYAKNNGVAVFFITGRKESLRPATAKNLKNAGYSDWKQLYMKPKNYDNPSVIPYKSAMRKGIEKQGYDIAISIGDQYSDLKGGYADMVFKVPDPYYFTA
ncbi:MAG: acid phosphatase [Gammaproteobacteria bacterium]|nr:acid phosphatase [Gammaproteobacteria bacterium]